MGRFWIFAGMLALAGCFERESFPSYLGQSGTGGTPTTPIPAGDGDLFDGEGGQPPACCVPDTTPPFAGPSWFQFGPPGSLGPCPGSATPGLTGYQEMAVEPHTCPACSCSAAECALPQGIHTNAAKCAGADGSVTIPFGPDPAAGWDGACSEEGALPANLQCGGAPCIQSISIPALDVAPCQPETGPAAPFPEPTWARMARECVLAPTPGETCGPGQACVPAPPGGLSLCLYAMGDPPSCPPDYPERTVFFTSVDDDRGCEACQCSPPEGAQCSAILSAFSEAACSSLVVAVLVSTSDPTCVDVITGTALGSAAADMVVDTPGSCSPSGGAPFGGVQPADPFTLCCQSNPRPPG